MHNILTSDSNITETEFYAALGTAFTIEDIKTMIYSLYMENKLYNNPTIPHIYLTTDDAGNIVWDNKFIAANTFKYISKVYKYSDMTTIMHQFSETTASIPSIKVTIPEINYDSASMPMVMFNNSFIYNINYMVDNGNFVCYIPSGDESYYYDPDELTFTLTVLIISNGATSVANSLAENYISKDDAIQILSRGSINLDKYATKTNLDKKANKYHTHSQYAEIYHNHDARYADYHHTHTEYITKAGLLAVAATLSDTDTAAFVTALQSVTQPDTTSYVTLDEITALFRQWGFSLIDDTWVYDGANVRLSISDDTSDSMRKLLEDDEDVSSLDLDDIIRRLIDRDIDVDMTSSNILLSNSITSNIAVGGIPSGTTYTTETSIDDILNDLLHTHVSLATVVAEQTPVYVDISLYNIDESNSLTDIDTAWYTTGIAVKDVYLTANFANAAHTAINTDIHITSITVNGTAVSMDEIVDGAYNIGTLPMNTTYDIVVSCSYDDFTVEDSYGISKEVISASTIVGETTIQPIRAIYFYGNTDSLDNDAILELDRTTNISDKTTVSTVVNTMYTYFILAYQKGYEPTDIRNNNSDSILGFFVRDETMGDFRPYSDTDDMDYDYLYYKNTTTANVILSITITLPTKES